MPAQQEESLPLEIAHVLFTDIVGYSKLLIDQQTQRLQQLQDIVRNTEDFRRAQTQGQLIRLPTGDGMALVFFGDAVAPVRCALEISHALQRHPEIELRMGVHSGAVYRIADINRNQNVAGGGINIAQRVMDCGDAGHILLSKAAADVLRNVSEWEEYLHDLGEAEVKHGLRVHIFNLYIDDLGNPKTPNKLRADPAVPMRPNLGPLVSKLCDRSSQVNVFTDFFIGGLKQQAGTPQICITYGEEKECHDSLVERLIYVQLKPIAEKKWGAQKSVVLFKKMRWAYEGDLSERQQELKRMLFAEFDPAYMEDDLSTPALGRLASSILSPLVAIQHNIFAAHWDRLTRELLAWYLAYWAKIKTNPAAPQFLIFLNFICPKAQAAGGWRAWLSRNKFDKRRLQSDLQGLIALQSAGCHCLLLKELVTPRQHEVEDWFSYHNIYDRKVQSELIERIFAPKAQPISMADIEHELQKIHQGFIKEKGYA